MTEIPAVWEIDSETGSRLLYPAGSAEAAKWWAENSDPHDLEPLEEERTPRPGEDPSQGATDDPETDQEPDTEPDTEVEDDDGNPG